MLNVAIETKESQKRVCDSIVFPSIVYMLSDNLIDIIKITLSTLLLPSFHNGTELFNRTTYYCTKKSFYDYSLSGMTRKKFLLTTSVNFQADE